MTVPDRFRESLDRYATNGIPTGDCLRAVLAGDLFAAFDRADPITAGYMVAIVAYVQMLPSGCWGSYEIVDAWIKTYRKQRAAERELNRHG